MSVVRLPGYFQNIEYSEALESRFEAFYNKSWIAQYYDYETRVTEDGIVFFFDLTRQEQVDTYRFVILISIPESTQKYFFPDSYWNYFFGNDLIQFAVVDRLSSVKHGCVTNGFPYTQAQFYTPPFFVIFKTHQFLKSNYLKFNNFLKQNSEHCVLSMLVYNTDLDQFVSQFSPGLTLPYSTTLNLNNVLEFQIVDSNGKTLEVSELSQLFISIKILKPHH